MQQHLLVGLAFGACLFVEPTFSFQGTTVVQEAYVKASNPGQGDRFGISVALWGDTLVVGAAEEDSSSTGVGGVQLDEGATDSGAVYVFVRSGGTWVQQAYLKASNAEVNDFFGAAVDIRGDTLVVGAWGEDSAATGVDGDQTSNAISSAGAVYVFERVGSTWSQTAYLKASNPDTLDFFGRSLALGVDLLAVGGVAEDGAATGVGGDQASNGAADAGAVYVFERVGGTWSQVAYLKASNTDAGDAFGSSLAVGVDRIAVGAIQEASPASGVGGGQGNGLAGAGAVYVFERVGGTWSQDAYLKASNPDAGDAFGWSMGLSGDTLAVGAHEEDSAAAGVGGDELDDSALAAGAAYVFVRGASGWSQQTYLKASNADAGDHFGFAVGVSGDRILVGSYREESWAIGVDGDQADNSLMGAGAAYLFERPEFGSTWTQRAYLKPSYTKAQMTFGYKGAISGASLAISGPTESGAGSGIGGDPTDTTLSLAGACYVFDLASSCGTQAYGAPSAVNKGVLAGLGLPIPGQTISFDVSGFQGSGVAFLGLSASPAGLPLFGGVLYVDPLQGLPAPGALLGFPMVAGSGQLTLPVPTGTAGIVLYAQAATVDLGLPQLIALSNGLRVEICP